MGFFEVIGTYQTQQKILSALYGIEPGTPFLKQSSTKTARSLKKIPVYFSWGGAWFVFLSKIRTAKPVFILGSQFEVLEGIIDTSKMKMNLVKCCYRAIDL